MRDNIFANNITGGTTSVAHVAVYLPSGGTSAINLTDNNNSYYWGTDAARQGAGQAGTTAGTNFFTTLAALKAYSMTLSVAGTNDNASLGSTGAVPFVSANNLHLACSAPEANMGVPIAALPDDIDSQARSATTPDIGADEITAPAALSAVSRKVHGAEGPFDINLPLSGPVGVECRSGGGTNAYQIVVTFASAVNATGASVTSGTGTVDMASGNGTNTLTIDLSGVTNAQVITVTLSCVDDGINRGDVSVSMGVLVGDSSGNASVNASDVSQTKLRSGQTTVGANFRSDVNVSGTINASDVSLVKLRSGTSLP